MRELEHMRGKNHRVLDLGGGQYQFESGGDIAHVVPFDTGGQLVPHVLIHDNDHTENLGDRIRHRGGAWGFDVFQTRGAIRVYPVPGSWSKFIEIEDPDAPPGPPTPFQVTQIGAHAVTYSIDYGTHAYDITISDNGIKTLITVQDGGPDTYVLGLHVNGLTVQDGAIYDGAELITRIGGAWLEDAAGTLREVSEVWSADQITISADLSGLVYPVKIDPTLGPVNPNKDAHMWVLAPTTNYGSLANVDAGWAVSVQHRIGLFGFDISPVPLEAVIGAGAMFEGKMFQAIGTFTNSPFTLWRLKRPSWVELQATFDIYSTGNNWSIVGAGDSVNDYTTVNESQRLTSSSEVGNFLAWGIQGIAQDCVNAAIGTLDLRLDSALGNTLPSERFIRIYSRDYSVAADRPKLTLPYTVKRGFPRSRLRSSGVNNRLSRGGLL